MQRGRRLDGVLVSGLSTLVLGIILFSVAGAGLFSTLGHPTVNSSSFNQISNGEYASENIPMAPGSVMFVTNSTGGFALVPSNSIGIINASNEQNYSVQSVPGANYTTGSSTFDAGPNQTLYANLSGNYTIIAFTHQAPLIHYSVLQASRGITGTALLGIGTLAIIGVIMVLAGLVTTIIGVTREVRARVTERKVRKIEKRP